MNYLVNVTNLTSNESTLGHIRAHNGAHAVLLLARFAGLTAQGYRKATQAREEWAQALSEEGFMGFAVLGAEQ